MSRVQVLERDGKPAFAVLPWEQYQKLCADAEMAMDVRAYDVAKAEAAGQERLPDALVGRLLNDESPILVWREHRGLSRDQLAVKAGLTLSRLADLEEDPEAAADEELRLLAAALDLDLEDLR
ncbi:MAG: helix-turn-helix transcriptional regulator [bacterium]|nr:helix-turn-helix transcriptional regulator [bacterium]